MAAGGWSPEKLTAYLWSIDVDEVYMTFAELDAVAGVFPESAHEHNAYWANSVTSRPHSRAWLDAGFLATPQFAQHRIWFRRGVPSAPGSSRRRSVTTTLPPTPDLVPTGESYRAEIVYDWLDAGEITLAAGRLVMPALAVGPGVYRFALMESSGEVRSYYVGESDDLFRRMNGYRNPGSTQATNTRMNPILLGLLDGGGTVRVHVVLEATLEGASLNFGQRPARLVVENTALLHLAAQGAVVENLRTA
jgi:hypothetical protein